MNCSRCNSPTEIGQIQDRSWIFRVLFICFLILVIVQVFQLGTLLQNETLFITFGVAVILFMAVSFASKWSHWKNDKIGKIPVIGNLCTQCGYIELHVKKEDLERILVRGKSDPDPNILVPRPPI